MILPAYINRMASIHPDGLDENQQYLKAVEPDYKEIIQNPSLRRRMSRIIKMGVACGLECIGNMPKEEIHSIITATGLGCLADTEKFMNNILDNKEHLLNPTAFIQSTFNTVGAQIALLCQNQAYNMTYVHRGFSFESALLNGLLRLQEGNQNVLVGAFDEVTETSHIIQHRMGLLKHNNAGEGAQFFLISKEKKEDSLVRISVPFTFTINPRSDKDAHITEKIKEYLDLNKIDSEKVYLYKDYKDDCGEYPTSSAYGVFTATKMLSDEPDNAHHILVISRYSNNYSFILLSKP